MTFWACVLKPGQKGPAKCSESDILHLSQACLHQPKAGKNYLQVQREGKVYSVACLEKDKREHECFDLFFEGADTTFISKGDSEIHLMGYIEPLDGGMEDSEEESADAKPAPKQSPKTSPKDSPKSSPKAAPVQSPKAEVAKSPKVAAVPSPKAEVAKSPKASPKVSPKAVPTPAADDEDDDEEGEEEELLEGEEGEEEELLEEGEEEELDEDEESDDEEEAAKAAAVSAQLKRKSAPQPEASPKKKPKSDPSPKVVAAPAADASAYVQKLVKYLKDHGSTGIGSLGSKVPRPNGVPKLGAILAQNKDKFAVSGDKVSAK
mmetsp:Transcript_117790/g.186501  ORF Transcript_117790/g.186501 Transcript_117790/m.186501 type:complete len:320 (-) Transcript_117790:185-1144(-)